MATYKLIQDIEAEDHILGPLTLRQFIFGLISVLFFYLSFLVVTKHAAIVLALFLPPAFFFGFFAVPFGRDQPTEIWALAKLRFIFKPRKRIWDQSGIKELVKVTVPKKIEKKLTNGLELFEVQSRLKVLANTLDSRGWAVKNAQAADSRQPFVYGADSDRLVDITPTSTGLLGATSNDDDVLDASSSPVAQHVEDMINASSQYQRSRLVKQLNDASQPPVASQWFMKGLAPKSKGSDDYKLAEQLRLGKANVGTSNLATVPSVALATNGNLTQPADPGILNLAKNNDFSVATIAREAKKVKGEDPDNNEVVISLH